MAGYTGLTTLCTGMAMIWDTLASNTGLALRLGIAVAGCYALMTRCTDVVLIRDTVAGCTVMVTLCTGAAVIRDTVAGCTGLKRLCTGIAAIRDTVAGCTGLVTL